MKRYIGLAIVTYTVWVLLFVLEKPVFLLLYQHSLMSLLPVVCHGVVLDFAMAGYLSVLPFLALAIKPFIPDKIYRCFLNIYFAIASFAVSLSFVANLALYGYWQFPLDATPIFYLLSSPSDALASAPWYVELAALLVTLTLATALWLLFRWLYRKISTQDIPVNKPVYSPQPVSSSKGEDILCDTGCCHPSHPIRRRLLVSVVLLLLTGLLFLPIRGGVTVSTNNTGKAYFSENQTLNHAAVNPLFSFMESLNHQKNFGSQYRFMDSRLARHSVEAFHQHLLQLVRNEGEAGAHSGTEIVTSNNHKPSILRMDRPDIYLIILESFSDTVTKVPDVTPNLNRLKQEGLYFSNFYANSFRTDRGLLSILMGFPSPATVSLMKYPEKTSKLSSITAHLTKAGYARHYYYGGDADFTNMRSFLINQGFQHITEDRDFPVGDRLSKWGVCDHLLFQKVQEDLKKDITGRKDRGVQPIFRVIQTSSSHEPFDVPYHRLKDPALNAFSYTDQSLGDFIRYLRKDKERWQRSLVILVPDHLGAWPNRPNDFQPWRFHIPMIWTGGALNEETLSTRFGSPHVVAEYGSQQDIAATLLGQIGGKNCYEKWDDMPLSKDLFDPSIPHYAWFMMHDGEGVATPEGCLIYDNQRQAAVYSQTRSKTKNWATLSVGFCKAYVQRLFDYIAKL